MQNHLQGEVRLLGDKSMSHRAMILAALADGQSIISNFPDSEVATVMLSSLRSLGIDMSYDGHRKQLVVNGGGLHAFDNKIGKCWCGNSATTMRLLTGMLAGSFVQNVTITGSDSLTKRPIRVDKCLQDLGFTNLRTVDGHLPIKVSRLPEKSHFKDTVTIEKPSAQVKTAVILANLTAGNTIKIVESMKTRDHTENMLNSVCDKCIEVNECTITVNNNIKRLNPLVGYLPGDISSAAFILVLAAILPNSDVVIKDVLLNPRRTAFIDVLRMVGCQVDYQLDPTKMVFGEYIGDIRLRSPVQLNAFCVNDPQMIVDMIDEIPALAALAACCNGIPTIRNANELRFKESDRISSILDAYKSLGLQYYEFDDGFSVFGGNLNNMKPCIVKTRNDHRIAMAFSLLKYHGLDIEIDDHDIIKQSFPDFNAIIHEVLK